MEKQLEKPKYLPAGVAVAIPLITGTLVHPAAAEGLLEPMIVTATSPTASESAPVVGMIDAQTIEERDIVDIGGAFGLFPNAMVVPGDGGRAVSFSIRGAAENTFHELTGGNGQVTYYADDIPFMNAYTRDLALGGVERITLLSGPRGTAFGAPGSMGAVIAEGKPLESDWHGNLLQSYGSYDLLETRIGTGGKIADGLFLGIDGLYQHGDGWFTDSSTGDDYGRTETLGGKMRLRWTLSEAFDLTLTIGIQRHDDAPPVFVPLHGSDPYDLIRTDPHAYAKGGQDYQALRAVWKGNDWQLMSVTSRQHSDFDDSDNLLLLDVFNPGFLQRQREQDFDSWTQEFRAESTDPDARWRWRTGLFYSYRDSFLDHFILGNGPREGANDIGFRLQDLAAYGELTARVGEKLEVTGGLRLQTTWDHTRSSFDPTPLAESLGGVPQKLNSRDRYDGVLPAMTAGWKWSDSQRSFARIATGMQPGGLAIASTGSIDYDSQHSVQYEIGHDASFLNEQLAFHAAVFYTDYRDYQSFQFNVDGQTVFNADRAHAWGGELEARYRPWEEFELSASTGLTRAEFDDFVTPYADYSGRRVDNIPSATANIAAAYRAKWGGMARIDWHYTGSVELDQGNTTSEGGYSTFDARIGYEAENFGIYLFGRNLFDKEYYTHSYLFQGLPAATAGIPRIIGAEVRAMF